MTRSFSIPCNLRWQELLSSDEIRNWVNGRRVPSRLTTELASPGVYRFIFPEARDGNSAHTPCYVGEAGKIGVRLRHHFRPERPTSDEPLPLGMRGLRPGWLVRGSIQNSIGDFRLQVLTIAGPVNFCGLTFDSDTIPNPFENSFLRRMLENWAILTSEFVDYLHPLNVRGTPHILADILKEARKRSSKKSDATERGKSKEPGDL